jgi:hypothetical protein
MRSLAREAATLNRCSHPARKRTDRLCVRDHGDENNVSFSSLKRHCITTSDLMLHDFLFSELRDELPENKVSLLSPEKRNDSIVRPVNVESFVNALISSIIARASTRFTFVVLLVR